MGSFKIILHKHYLIARISGKVDNSVLTEYFSEADSLKRLHGLSKVMLIFNESASIDLTEKEVRKYATSSLYISNNFKFAIVILGGSVPDTFYSAKNIYDTLTPWQSRIFKTVEEAEAWLETPTMRKGLVL